MQIIALRDRVERELLPTLGKKSKEARNLIVHMYKNPILDGAQIAEILEVHASTANRLTADLIELGILREMTGYRRNRVYAFEPYIKLFRN